MAQNPARALNSSYIFSLTSQLGTGRDTSEHMTNFLTQFKTTDGEALVEKSGPLVKDDEHVVAVTDDFLKQFGEALWPSTGSCKDQKLRWSIDKDKIADLVSTIFIEKFRIYHGKTNKDSAVDSNDSTPQPPQKNTSMASTGSTSMTESSPPQEPEKVSKKPTIVPGVSNEQRNSSVSWKTQDSYGVSPLHQESGRQTAARTSEVVADDTSSCIPGVLPSPTGDGEENATFIFPSEDEYRQGVIAAIERSHGEPLAGAIQLNRQKLRDASVRETVSSPTRGQTTGHIRLTQINTKYMAWCYKRLDGTCLWVRPFVGRVVNGFARFAGWTGEDGVFTNHTVTHAVTPPDSTTPRSTKSDPNSTTAAYNHAQISERNTNSGLVILKHSKAAKSNLLTTPKVTATEIPSYIRGDAMTMERARAAIATGVLVDPPCDYCKDSNNDCMMLERARTCAFCIAQNRTATHCEMARGIGGQNEADDRESPLPPAAQTLLTQSGRIVKKPARGDYVDPMGEDSEETSFNDDNPDLDTIISPRRTSSIKRTMPSIKRNRDSSMKAGVEQGSTSRPEGIPPQSVTSHLSPASPAPKREHAYPEVWFSFDTTKVGEHPKKVAATNLTTMHAFFDAAIDVWKKSGGNANTSFYGVDATWPERPMFVEWRDEKDWSRMMQMLKRAHGDEHGELEVAIKYRLA